jgi:hypothetical protein
LGLALIAVPIRVTALWILLLGLTPIVWVAWVFRTTSAKSHQRASPRLAEFHTPVLKDPDFLRLLLRLRLDRCLDVGLGVQLINLASQLH